MGKNDLKLVWYFFSRGNDTAATFFWGETLGISTSMGYIYAVGQEKAYNPTPLEQHPSLPGKKKKYTDLARINYGARAASRPL